MTINSPEALANAPEEERLQAANAVIEQLRQQRAKSHVPAPEQMPVREVESPAYSPLSPDYIPANPILAAVPLDAPETPRLTVDQHWTKTKVWAQSMPRPAAFAGVACISALGGFLLANVMHDKRDGIPLKRTPISKPVAMLEDTRAGRIAELEFQNAMLQQAVTELEDETTELQNEMLQAELQILQISAPAIKVADVSAINSIVGDPLENESVAHQGQRDAPSEYVDEILQAFQSAGLNKLNVVDMSDAFARARRDLELIDLGREDPSANFADLDAARRRINENLVAAIGIDNVAAGRHALGEPNLLSVSNVADQMSSVLPGDVLMSVDGKRIIDFDQLRWMENDAGDRADDAGESGEAHTLEVLRDGQQLALVFDAPLGQLILEADSVSPELFK